MAGIDETISESLDISSPINYIVGGKLGDFIHLLYVVKRKYDLTGSKGNLYITNDTSWECDQFEAGITITYQELYPIVIHQEYIECFEILEAQTDLISGFKSESIPYINLNLFRKGPIWERSWFDLLNIVFDLPPITNGIYGWVKLPPDCVDPFCENKIVIHRKLIPKNPFDTGFVKFLRIIVERNDCVFIGSTRKQYDTFVFREQVPFYECKTIFAMFAAMNSSKFFIGNQTAPLALAYALEMSLMAEEYWGVCYSQGPNSTNYNWYRGDRLNGPSLKQCVKTYPQLEEMLTKSTVINSVLPIPDLETVLSEVEALSVS